MEKEQFDRIMRLLVEGDPQTMVAFLLKDAIYEGELNRELALIRYEGELKQELQARILDADELYHVLWNKEHVVLHLEFQRYGESEVPRKIWECNALTSIITGKLVHSVVIYGLPEPVISEPVYQIRLPNGQVCHSFSFDQIKLWEIEPEVFEQPRFVGLLPLLPLTKDGQNRETVDRMLRKMEEVMPPGLMLKTSPSPQLALRSEEDRRWLQETMLDLFKDSPGYQEAIRKGREKGIRQAAEEDCLLFVELRFPPLLPQAKQVIEQGMSIEQLEALLKTLYLAKTIEEAAAALQSA
jgi:hypothetical protein